MAKVVNYMNAQISEKLAQIIAITEDNYKTEYGNINIAEYILDASNNYIFIKTWKNNSKRGLILYVSKLLEASGINQQDYKFIENLHKNAATRYSPTCLLMGDNIQQNQRKTYKWKMKKTK